ncbi:hypothetical protein [Ciceribacter selenitireducens]|jgi:hypothetical protein|uniref:hypothetical protein n=1 Tax=Ciceribacter selenitireducens TaxID=448181 RepID=UPI000E20B354|nr:hypothetical protein [Ciceribacter selenitireducens]
MSVQNETPLPAGTLLALRAIGFGLWDPIGLNVDGEVWSGSPFEDEYDRYLLEVVARFLAGETADHLATYLCDIESVHMGLGLGISDKTASRASAAVREIGRLVEDLRTEDI